MVVEISEKAQKDLIAIYLYTKTNWSKKQGRNYLFGLERTFKTISKNPNLGMSINDIISNARKLRFESHLVVYQIEEKSIKIDRILHKNQLP